jgi:hypothetical protein
MSKKALAVEFLRYLFLLFFIAGLGFFLYLIRQMKFSGQPVPFL